MGFSTAPEQMSRKFTPIMRNGSELHQDSKLVKVGPMLHDLTVHDAEEVNLGPRVALTVRRDTQELVLASFLNVVVKYYEITLRHHIIDVHLDIGECVPRREYQLPESLFRSRYVRSRHVVHYIAVREYLLKNLHPSLAEDIFC